MSPRAPKPTKYETWCELPLVPCAVLAIDPGDNAGAALTVWDRDIAQHRMLWARAVRTDSLELEACILDAIREADARGLILVLAIEEWGRGGPLGIDQWMGLGAAAGAWKRAAKLLVDTEGPTIARSRLSVRIAQTSWRSALISEWGTRDDDGVWKPHDSAGWKRAATKRCLHLFGSSLGDLSSDAAEAVLLAYFASRSEAIDALVPDRWR